MNLDKPRTLFIKFPEEINGRAKEQLSSYSSSIISNVEIILFWYVRGGWEEVKLKSRIPLAWFCWWTGTSEESVASVKSTRIAGPLLQV